MPEKNIISAYHEARSIKENIQKEVFQLKEKYKKLGIEKQQLRRSQGIHSKLGRSISDEEAKLWEEITDKELELKKSTEELEKIVSWNFSIFSDPTKSINLFFFHDYPILMFPVRMETRFKKITTQNEETQHQLWVRIFPDECSIDTFEDTLSEIEIAKARQYWCNVWAAGKPKNNSLKPVTDNLQKAAWKGLTSTLQPGRAYWVKESFKPRNLESKPERTEEQQIILVIEVEKLPSDIEQKPIIDYWKNKLMGNSDQKIHKNYERFKPWNFEESIILFEESITSKENVNPLVSFIQFPKKDEITAPRLSSWSNAAKVRALPDRFVLMGFKGKEKGGAPKEIFRKTGNIIPDPLLIGPDPSIDFKTTFVEGLLALDEEKKKEQLKEFYDNLIAPEASNNPNNSKKETKRNTSQPDRLKLEKDFESLKDDYKAAKYIDYLHQKSDTKWYYDFDEAIKVGMGFKIDLKQEEYNNGFDRLFAIGVKISSDAMHSRISLEELLRHHHYGNGGFSILKQGTPTNNSEEEGSGFSEQEDFEETYKRYAEEDTENSLEVSKETRKKTDGEVLCEILGIDAKNASIERSANYYNTDQSEAQAMNTALWPATIGYFMESMLTNLFTDRDVDATRKFFIDFVKGRGNLPAIRIGDQPYGILPATAIKKTEWLNGTSAFRKSEFSEEMPFLRNLYKFFLKIYSDWQKILEQTANVSKEGDPYQILLDTLGLHASSVEFYQRYARSASQLYNQLNLGNHSDSGYQTIQNLNPMFAWKWTVILNILSPENYYERIKKAIKDGTYKKEAAALIQEFLDELKKENIDLNKTDIPILEKIFISHANHLKVDLIDDRPLSEKGKIGEYAGEKKNYIDWIWENINSDFDKIKNQEGFKDNKEPSALLYHFLRNALMLEFYSTALRLNQREAIKFHEDANTSRADNNYLGFNTNKLGLESKLDILNLIDEKNISVSQYISGIIKNNEFIPEKNQLELIINALGILKDVPTARLERAFVEHLDCCTYRLDAWLLGFVNMQLKAMRSWKESNEGKEGIYLGAFNWLEDVIPANEKLETVKLKAEIKNLFDPDNKGDIKIDSSNAGYIHAPSLNHAVTSAVLRNAYLSNANPKDPEIYKVNLSSERVRMALSIIEGIQHGQSLGSLLGYQLERGLHDRHDEAEVDIFIYELRKAFPLAANRMKETAENDEDLESISQIDARNVIDGLALVNHIKSTGKSKYPFGKELKKANSKQKKAINAEVDRILNINDAVADLAISESVHQIVQANYDRAAASLDSYSKGTFPQFPDVIKTPRSGVTLTNRFGIHFQSGISPDSRDNSLNPRVIAEPVINAFLENILPPLERVFIEASINQPDYLEHNSGNDDSSIPKTKSKEKLSLLTIRKSIKDLGLAPIDLLYVLDIEKEKTLSALDDFMMHQVFETQIDDDNSSLRPRADVEININYSKQLFDESGKPLITIFELAPLIKSLRSLLLNSRPLKPSDLMLQNEISTEDDIILNLGKLERIGRVKDDLKGLLDNSSDGESKFKDGFLSLVTIGDLELTSGNKVEIIEGIDSFLGDYVDLLFKLNHFGLCETCIGDIYNRKAAIFSSVYKKVGDYLIRWNDKKSNYNDLMNQILNTRISDKEKIKILQNAHRTISTDYLAVDKEMNIGQLEEIVVNKKKKFDDKFTEINDFLEYNHQKIRDLFKEFEELKSGDDPLSKYDFEPLEIIDSERQVLIYAEDIAKQLQNLNTVVYKKIVAIEELVGDIKELIENGKISNEVVKLEDLQKAGKILFGEAFQMIPEYKLPDNHMNELKKCYNDQEQLLKYQKQDLQVDFPMDDWLYGLARVREKMGHWENIVILSENFKSKTQELAPFQIPYIDNDTWLGLSFPDSYLIESEKLLYTAYLDEFKPVETLCGILVDEWIDLIPQKKETTGLTFQSNQPNAEPPQTMLLVTPTKFDGNWAWDEIVNSMHETLDLAKLRSIEPKHIDQTSYAQFIPATLSTATSKYATIGMIFDGIVEQIKKNDNG
ncbi:MAG: hypothetical protein IH598_17675 [Bacteroidales bacterium]|nr:hypothetical protein [Bacteroidales bacterium]